MMPSLITYQLIISIEHRIETTIGRLGRYALPAGRYVYTGSAKKNLEARIARHLRQEKSLRWHIDWLLATDGVKVVEVRRFCETECLCNQAVGGVIVVPGFGASDCRNGCGSHLRYLGAGS